MLLDNETLDLLSVEAEKPHGENAMRNAVQMAARLAWLERYKQQVEALLETVNNKLHHYKTFVVPEAMAQASQQKFTLDSNAEVSGETFAGVTVEVADFVAGSLPKELTRRKEAVEYLRANSGEPLVKDTLVVEVPRNKGNDVSRVMQQLRDDGYNVDRTSTVHPQSLQAYARERLRKGEPTDFERIGIFVGRAAKLKWPKTKAEY